MNVQFAPNNYQPDGVLARVSWSNQDLEKAMDMLFRTSPRERISELVIDMDGITAKFEQRK